MLFPQERMSFTRTHEGKTDPNGFVILNLKGLDIEGVTKLVLRWADLESVRESISEGENAAKRLRELLSE